MRKTKRNYLIVALIIILLSLTIGYAAFSDVLTISGTANAKGDWRDNVIVHRNIKKELDDLLFDYLEENDLNWTLDTIDIIIDEILMVAKKVY